MKISELFAKNIRRHIEEIIKVNDLDDKRLLDEIREYHPTPRIQEQMRDVLEAYDRARHGPTQDVGIWISGFFGAGKSSFAKLLGVLLGDVKVGAQTAVDLFSERITDDGIKVKLAQIREHLPTHVVMFDILKDQIAGAREHPVTVVFYKALLRSLDYAQDLQLAELEINLERKGLLQDFEEKYEEVYEAPWREERTLLMIAPSQASRILYELDPDTYHTPDNWSRNKPQVSLTPLFLAERALELSEARAGGRTITFVVDEVGQYVSQGLDRIADLNGVIESFGMVGEGSLWLAAVSQEKLEAILNVYGNQQNELVRLKDRFPHRVFLSSTDIREVTSHRVLRKTAEADEQLRTLYTKHVGRLASTTKLVGSKTEYPALTEDSFVDLYPFLPSHIDLLIDVINGLRSHSGVQAELGAGNRKIIGLAQQLLIHEQINLAGQEVGALVTLDEVYRLMERDLPPDLKAEVQDIEQRVGHPCAGQVAKALALLQFVPTLPTTEENLAAVLQATVDGPSLIEDVRGAVEKLLEARKIRRTDSGLKIQSAVERGWDEERDSRVPTEGDRQRTLKSSLTTLWGKGAQAPNAQLGGWKRFTAELRVGGESLVEGEIPFQIRLLRPDVDREKQVAEARALTQQPANNDVVVWTLELSDAAERAITEVYRSDRMLRKTAATAEEERLRRDEQQRHREATRVLQDELERCLCNGRIFFQGNDRSPAEGATRAKTEAQRVLGPALKAIYHRFHEADVRVSSKDVEAVITSETLAALPACYVDLELVQTSGGQVRLVTDDSPAATVLTWIRNEAESGQASSGKQLEHHFGNPPFGWSLDLLRLLVATLLRAGVITITANAQEIEAARSPEAKRELTSNNRFRALTLRPKKSGAIDPSELREAGKLLQQRFGHQVKALTPDGVRAAIDAVLCSKIGPVEEALDTARRLDLPGEDTLQQALVALRSMREKGDEGAIRVLLESVEVIHKGLRRASGFETHVTPEAEELLDRSRAAIRAVLPVLQERLEEGTGALEAGKALQGALTKETFYEELPSLREKTTSVLDAGEGLYQRAFAARQAAYQRALTILESTPGWPELDRDTQEGIAGTLRQRAEAERPEESWRHVRDLELLEAHTRAVDVELQAAQEELRQTLLPEAVTLTVRDLVPPEIRGEEDLEAALSSIREAVQKELSENHPVILR